MRIVLAQVTTGADPSENLASVERAVTAVAGGDIDLVVFPEATMQAFGTGPLGPAAAGYEHWVAGLSAIACRHGVAIVAGAFRPAADGRIHNTVVVVGPTGEVLASYDKRHLFDAFGFRESDTVASGSDTVVVPLAGVPVGIATCYDIRFPMQFRELADAGAQLVVVPTSWGAGPGKLDQWRVLTRARALDATVFIAACGQADPAAAPGRPVRQETRGPAPTGIGHSVVVAPDGAVLGELGPAPGLLVVAIDPEDIARVRRSIPVLADRRAAGTGPLSTGRGR